MPRPDNYIRFAGEVGLDLQAAGETGGPKVSVMAYGGGLMTVAPWGPVVVDLAGLESPDRLSLLSNHDRTLPGIIGNGVPTKVGGRLIVDGALVPGDTAADRIIQLSKAGTPFGASIGMRVTKADYIKAGETITANGQTIKAPSGGFTLIRRGRLDEVSILAVGADAGTQVSIAAKAADLFKEIPNMEYDQWLQARGFAAADLTEKQAETMKAAYDVELAAKAAADEAALKAKAAEPDALKAQADAMAESLRAAAAQETEWIAGVQKRFAGQFPDLQAKAFKERWDTNKIELEILRAERPTGPSIHASTRDAGPQVLEAAFCRYAGMPGMDKTFKPEVLEASDHKSLRGFGLHQLLLRAAFANGYDGPHDVRQGNVREVMEHAFLRAGASTIDIAGILSNTANKFLLAGFDMAPKQWRQVANTGRVNDFKESTFYRLTASLEYEQVPASGKIPSGTLGEESYTASIKTYAKLLALSRTQIINDDLGALDDIRRRLGMGAAMKMNTVFWKAWIAASNAGTFWSATHKNLSGSSTFAEPGIAAAVKLFDDMPMPDGGLMGLQPDRVLVPSTLRPTSEKWYKSAELRDTTGSTKTLNVNIYQGKYLPVVVPELEQAAYGTGYSATTWWLLCDPAVLASATMFFLDGVEAPTIESADADFDELGIQFRGYHDFGVAMTEYRASVKATV